MRVASSVVLLLSGCAGSPTRATFAPTPYACQVVEVRHAGGESRIPLLAQSPGPTTGRFWLLDGEQQLLAEVAATAWNDRLGWAALRVYLVRSMEDVVAVSEVAWRQRHAEAEGLLQLGLRPAPPPLPELIRARYASLLRDEDHAPAIGGIVRLYLRDPRDGLLLDAVVRPAPEKECELATGLLHAPQPDALADSIR